VFEGNIKVLEIEKIDHPKIAGITTIYLQDIGKISGIKIVRVNGEVKCEPPNRSFVDNGMRKWENVFSFERDLWNKIQEKIVKEWQKCR
jgi:hypothetical protein